MKEKTRSVAHLYELITEDERIIVEVLRQIILEQLPDYCQEKISYNVPYFYGKKGICLVWPASIPRGGIKEGVLLGFWNGYLLEDVDQYLDKGTNKKIYYKIYKSVEEIDVEAIVKLLQEAVRLDQG